MGHSARSRTDRPAGEAEPASAGSSAGSYHPALSGEIPLEWRGQHLFPRAVRPRVFALLWILLLVFSGALAVIAVFYLHAIGA